MENSSEAPLHVSDLLLTRISELEAKYPSEVAESKLINELLCLDKTDIVVNESTFCHDFDTEVVNQNKTVSDRIQLARIAFKNEILSAHKLDRAIFDEFVACNKAYSEYLKSTEILTATKKDHCAAMNIRGKLQDLCHALQSHNKEVSANAAAERGNTVQLDAHFGSSIEKVHVQLAEQEESLRLQETENNELQEKLNEFEGHFALRTQHYSAQLKAKDLEMQLEQARNEKRQHVKTEISTKHENISAKILSVSAANEEIKRQLALYEEKFVVFQDTLSHSTSLFNQFDAKVVSLNEKIERMKTENSLRKEICGKLDYNLLNLHDEKSTLKRRILNAQTAKFELQRDCHKLQQTRSELMLRKNEVCRVSATNA